MQQRDHNHFWQYPGDNISITQARLQAKTIFREMIATELRAGRLTPWGRTRLVRYASEIGLSAEEAGRLIAECQSEARALAKGHGPEPDSRFEEDPLRNFSLNPKVAITTGILLLIIWLTR